METTPTDITEEHYFNSMYAVTSDGNTWMLYSLYYTDDLDSIVWLGYDEDAWNYTMDIGGDECQETTIDVTDEDGNVETKDAVMCPMSLRPIQLDLDALRNGQVIWFSTM